MKADYEGQVTTWDHKQRKSRKKKEIDEWLVEIRNKMSEVEIEVENEKQIQLRGVDDSSGQTTLERSGLLNTSISPIYLAENSISTVSTDSSSFEMASLDQSSVAYETDEGDVFDKMFGLTAEETEGQRNAIVPLAKPDSMYTKQELIDVPCVKAFLYLITNPQLLSFTVKVKDTKQIQLSMHIY